MYYTHRCRGLFLGIIVALSTTIVQAWGAIPTDVTRTIEQWRTAAASGDAKEIAALFVGDNDRLRDLVNAMAVRIVAERQLVAVAGQTFGGAAKDPATYARFIFPLESHLGAVLKHADEFDTQVTADRAIVRPPTKPINGLFIQEAVVLRKIGSNWRLDASEMFHLSPGESAEARARLYREHARIADEAVKGIKDKSLKDFSAVAEFVTARRRIAARAYASSRPATRPSSTSQPQDQRSHDSATSQAGK